VLGVTKCPASTLARAADTAVASPPTNIYPLVTLVIAQFRLNGRLNGLQAVGIVIAVEAIVLLSGEAKNLATPAAVLRRIG